MNERDKAKPAPADTAVLVNSFDGYADAWEPFFHFFFKFWPDCPYSIYLVSQSKRYDDPRVTTLNIPEQDWSACLKTALGRIPHRRVIYLQEDYFLKSPVDSKEIERLIGVMAKEGAVCLRLYPVPPPDGRFAGYDDIGEIGTVAPYKFSFQAAIWDKSALEGMLIPGESPWQAELTGSKRADQAGLFLSVKKAPAGSGRVSPVLEYVWTGIIKGRWSEDAVRFFRAQGFSVEVSKRGVESVSEYRRRRLMYAPFFGGFFILLYRSKGWLKRMLIGGRLKRRLKESRMKRFYSEFVRPGDLCFDVGANIGNRTSVFRKLGARVIAVEPQKSCAEALKRTFGSDPEVTILREAIGAKPGSAKIMETKAHTISSMSPEWIEKVKASGRFGGYSWDKAEEVNLVTLDSLIERFGAPSFCKIDVEGYEAEVLKGLSRPIKSLSFEFTPEFLDPALQCIDKLVSLGHYGFNYSLGESMKLSLQGWLGPEEIKEAIRSLPKEVFGDIYARTASVQPR